MPHAVFEMEPSGATVILGPRELIPGVTPGGQFAGKAKPALLINDAYVQLHDMESAAAADVGSWVVELLLSQELDMTPGLLLPVADINIAQTGTAELIQAFKVEQHGHRLAGTIWAPRLVGVRVGEGTGGTQIDVSVHLDYERIWLPWRDWFVHWEFLDGVSDLTREY